MYPSLVSTIAWMRCTLVGEPASPQRSKIGPDVVQVPLLDQQVPLFQCASARRFHFGLNCSFVGGVGHLLAHFAEANSGVGACHA